MLSSSKPIVNTIVIHQNDNRQSTAALLPQSSSPSGQHHHPYNYWTINDRLKSKNDYLLKRQKCSCRLAFYSLWLLISACVLFIIAYRFTDECSELVKHFKCKRFGLFLLSISIASLACCGVFCGVCQYFRSQPQPLTPELYYDKVNNTLTEETNLHDTRHCCCVHQQHQPLVLQQHQEDEKTTQTTVQNISSISSITSSSIIHEQQQQKKQQSPKIDQGISSTLSSSPLLYHQIQPTSNKKVPPFTYEEISPQIKKSVDKSVSSTSSMKDKLPSYHHTILLSSSSSSSSPHSICVGINKILMNDIADDEQCSYIQAQTPSSYTTCLCSPTLIHHATQTSQLEVPMHEMTEKTDSRDDTQTKKLDIWEKNEDK
ncbi:unnamed protein product, partial [Didymodactylos carnosus]